MSYEELKELFASVAAFQKETAERMRKTDEQFRETDVRLREIAEEIRETDRRFKEAGQHYKYLEQCQKETDQQLKETGRQIKELGKQIGGLGEKFGSFTEGLALPSMTKILAERFGMEVVSPSVRVSKQGQHVEIDVLAYANGDLNEVYVVEVKRHAREEAIEQLRSILERFRRFFPEHKDKAVYGILAAVDMSAALREQALKAGFYVARIHDAVFELDVPANFKPKAY